MPIDTRQVKDRRKVAYATLQEVLADAERLSQGQIKALGNWSPGQIFLHLAKAFNNSIDGSDARFPWYLCMMARLMKKKILTGAMPPGYQLPAEAGRALEPGPTSTEKGLGALRNAIARQERESKRAKHPVFGELTRDEWNQVHLQHSALHMSFLVPS